MRLERWRHLFVSKAMLEVVTPGVEALLRRWSKPERRYSFVRKLSFFSGLNFQLVQPFEHTVCSVLRFGVWVLVNVAPNVRGIGPDHELKALE